MNPRTVRLVAAAVVLLIVAAPFYLAPFSVSLMNYIGVYALVALGLVLLTGVGGMVSFGQSAFMGIAAYATAWLSAVQGLSPWLGLVLALVLTGAVAAILGAVTLRLKGHFLSLSTIAWGLAIYFTFGNFPGLGNYSGITAIPPISIGSIALETSKEIYYLIWAILLGAMLLSHNLLNSRMGRAMRALRGGNAMVESLGVNAFRVRLVTFVISALLAAFAGWLYAHMNRFVSPTPFDVTMGIEFLMMAMVGGSGYLLGAIVGSALITLLKNSVQDYLPLIAPSAAGQLEIVVFSALFIVFLQYAREGIVPFVAHFLPEPKRRPPEKAEPLPRRAQPEPGRMLLTAEACTRHFGGLVAVNDVSFELKSGEILGLIGPNGSGKTTLLGCIAGNITADGGSIRISGREMLGAPAFAVARSGVARNFQSIRLFSNLTALENVKVAVLQKRRSVGLADATARARALLAELRIEALAERRSGDLAYGQQRRVEIARALALEPNFLLLDEPAAGMNESETDELLSILDWLTRHHRLGLLIVDHDMSLIMRLCHRIAVLNKGQLIGLGSPAEIQASPEVRAAYLGRRHAQIPETAIKPPKDTGRKL